MRKCDSIEKLTNSIKLYTKTTYQKQKSDEENERLVIIVKNA